MKQTWTILPLALLICVAAFAQGSTSETHLGGCILLKPGKEAPADIYYDTGIVRTDEYAPQTKKIEVYGFTLAGNDDISDQFMLDVSTTIKEIFPRNRGLDEAKQSELLKNQHRYRGLIPMFDNEIGFLKDDDDEKAWLATESACSVCDVIFKTPRGQVMEVVEHILHYTSTIALHYTFPEEWGNSDTSQINKFMLEAIEKKYYNVGQYDRFSEDKERQRVLIQEFSYWVISTMWNLQEPYGPAPDSEWTIGNRVQLKEKMPELFAMHEATVGKIMVPPRLQTLDKFPDSVARD